MADLRADVQQQIHPKRQIAQTEPPEVDTALAHQHQQQGNYNQKNANRVDSFLDK